jgi:hypothetical protein
MKQVLLIGTVTMLLAGQAFSADVTVSESNVTVSESNVTVSESNATVVEYKEMTAEEAENIIKNKQKNSKKIGAISTVNGGGVIGAAIGGTLFGLTVLYNKIVDNTEKDK